MEPFDIQKLVSCIDRRQEDQYYIKYSLEVIQYTPFLEDSVEKLIEKLGLLEEKFPKVVLLLLSFVNKNKHITLMEDWLLIMPFKFVWENNIDAISWFEDLFDELASNSPQSWQEWSKDISQKHENTNDLCNRLYSYLLHLYGALYLIRNGASSLSIPKKSNIPDVDIVALDANANPIAMECKFLGTSKKFESYFSRMELLIRRFTGSQRLCVNNFSFPMSEKIESLNSEQCTAVKMFIINVAKNPYFCHIATFGDLIFRYDPLLPPAMEINFQVECAEVLADELYKYLLKNKLEPAVVKQLNNAKYTKHKKILFMGVQTDSFLNIEWTAVTIKQIKAKLIKTAEEQYGIELIFSEDAGYPLDGYL